MANYCQPCGARGIPPEQFRIIWMDNFYLEWDKDCPCGCGDTPQITLTNRDTGEVKTFSPNEAWVLFGGGPEQVGLMTA